MSGWYESTLRICLTHKIRAVIFHNECSDKFCQKYSNKFLTFEKWDQKNRPSYNDERFYCFKEYLKANSHIKRAISTDMFDVKIFGNPFELMDKEPNYHLYCGSEKGNVPGSYGRKWVNTKMRRCKLGIVPNEEMVYNAGICGGKADKLITFYSTMQKHFKNITPKENANMAVFNRSIRDMKEKGWKIFTGYPLHNVFESNKVKPGTYVKHK